MMGLASCFFLSAETMTPACLPATCSMSNMTARTLPCQRCKGSTELVSHACRGFPPAITQLKGVFERMHPTLPKENPGSRWPKTSLGALRDDKRLTPDQLQLLLKICRQEGGLLQEAGLQPLEIDRAALCIFECRSVSTVPVALSLLIHKS